MASSSSMLIFTIFMAILLTSSVQGRKLLMNTSLPAAALHQQSKHSMVVPTLKDMRMYFTALPKGKVPASTPTKKGHAVTIDEKLIARQLAAVDRILQSVPSPGVGH